MSIKLNNGVYSFAFLIPIIIVLLFVNWIALMLFIALYFSSLIIFLIRAKKMSKRIEFGKGNFPFYLPSIIISLTFALMLIDIRLLLIIGGIAITLIGINLYKRKMIKKYVLVYIITTIFCVTMGISMFNIRPIPIVPADFSYNKDMYDINYSKYTEATLRDLENVYKEYEDYGYMYKSLLFIAVQTDYNDNPSIINYNQANFMVQFNVSKYIQNTETFFWNCRVDTRAIYYDGIVREIILDQNLNGYELYDYMYDLSGLSEYYSESTSFNSTIIDASFVKMGTYLIAIDLSLPISSESESLYDLDIIGFASSVNITIDGSLNFGYTPTRQGYAYVVTYLMEGSEAENLFDDLIGIDTLNTLILFFIVFFITLLIALVQRNLKLITIMNMILLCLFLLGLFGSIAHGMDNVPNWMTILFSVQNAKYIWGVIEAVKYGIIMGSALGIIFTITGYVTSAFGLLFDVRSVD